MSVYLTSKVYREVKVGAAVHRVLLCLCDAADDDGICWPSIEHIAWKIGVGRRTVERAIHDLRNAGALTVQERPGRSSIYQIHLDALPRKEPFRGPKRAMNASELSPKAPESGSNASELSPKTDPKETNLRQNDVPTPPQNDALNHQRNLQESEKGENTPKPSQKIAKTDLAARQAEWFESIWKVYPRKVGKPAAFKAFQKQVRTEAEAAALAGSIPKWAATDQWSSSGGRYIPHPSTFLNRRQWEDPVPDGNTATDDEWAEFDRKYGIVRDEGSVIETTGVIRNE